MAEEIEVTFKIQYKVKVKKSPPSPIPLSIIKGKTVFDMMGKAQAENAAYQFTYKNYGSLGAYIISIGGIKENPKENHYWFFYDRNKKIPTGVSTFKPQNGDIVVASYEAYQPCFEVNEFVKKADDEIDGALSSLSNEIEEQDKLVLLRLRELALASQWT